MLIKHLRKQANQTPLGRSARIRSTRCASTSGSRRTSRRTSARWPSCIGVERILFGSDWPHGEGIAQPLDFVKELGAFDETEIRKIMRDNCLELLGANA